MALGRRAEEAVAGLLRARGARILARNHRPRGGGEVDIIALEGDTLRFVEVKARRRGRPRDLVTWAQQLRLEASMDLWLAKRPHEGPVTLELALMTVDAAGLVEEIDFIPLA
ncbi:YraN family protein [bacterium]|nr:YraN family protein [bacterium]